MGLPACSLSKLQLTSRNHKGLVDISMVPRHTAAAQSGQSSIESSQLSVSSKGRHVLPRATNPRKLWIYARADYLQLNRSPDANPNPRHADYSTYVRSPQEGWNTLAIVAAVTCIIPFASLILGPVALRQIESTGQRGRRLAIAAVAVGAAVVVAGILLFVAAWIIYRPGR
jgi:hypothetical protein